MENNTIHIGQCPTCTQMVQVIDNDGTTEYRRVERPESKAIAALKAIANPLEYLQAEADKGGMILNGLTATLVNNAEFLKEIARKALEEVEP